MQKATEREIQKALVRLVKSRKSVMRFERFVHRSEFLSPREKNILMIAGSEVCDNLITHGEVGFKGITCCIRRQKETIVLSFYVQSHEIFTRFADELEFSPTRKPRYDEREKRWHGLGLTMCSNLADKIRYRPGTKIDRVYLEFARV